jgi:hypothetical protein
VNWRNVSEIWDPENGIPFGRFAVVELKNARTRFALVCHEIGSGDSDWLEGEHGEVIDHRRVVRFLLIEEE